MLGEPKYFESGVDGRSDHFLEGANCVLAELARVGVMAGPHVTCDECASGHVHRRHCSRPRQAKAIQASAVLFCCAMMFLVKGLSPASGT